MSEYPKSFIRNQNSREPLLMHIELTSFVHNLSEIFPMRQGRKNRRCIDVVDIIGMVNAMLNWMIIK